MTKLRTESGLLQCYHFDFEKEKALLEALFLLYVGIEIILY